MQVDPIKPKLKPPGTKRLKLKYDILLSTSAFKFNLRRFIQYGAPPPQYGQPPPPPGYGYGAPPPPAHGCEGPIHLKTSVLVHSNLRPHSFEPHYSST